jgi:hypothetical protein
VRCVRRGESVSGPAMAVVAIATALLCCMSLVWHHRPLPQVVLTLRLLPTWHNCQLHGMV